MCVCIHIQSAACLRKSEDGSQKFYYVYPRESSTLGVSAFICWTSPLATTGHNKPKWLVWVTFTTRTNIFAIRALANSLQS